MLTKNVLFITGPSGCGKTSLGKRIAENKGWTFISEDLIWGELFPNHESRTEEMQRVVMKEAFRRIISQKGNVVFEFLVYTNPPSNLIRYKRLLRQK